VRHDYTLLGYDVAAGTLDMMVRWAGDGGHCPLHRHTATTTVLVIDGEQHLTDVLADGSPGEHKVRTAGDYALSLATISAHTLNEAAKAADSLSLVPTALTVGSTSSSTKT
jgi:hypothetical protein